MPAESATPVRPFVPWLTRGLTVANVAVFAALALAGVNVLRPDPLAYIHWGSNFAPLTTGGEWWRLATAAFLHFGVLHLLFNSWALWVIGSLVERLFGHGRFGAIYAVGGLAGSLASVAWNPLVNSAGASGAIFGIIGAQLAFFTRGGHRIPAEAIRAQRNGALGFIAYSVIFGFIVPGIDNAAHLGGLAAGFGMGWLLARPLGAPDTGRRNAAGPMLAGAFALAVMAAGGVAATRAAAQHAAEQGYLRDWVWYARAEPPMLTGMGEVMSAARDRRTSDAAVVDWLERTGIPFYRDASRRLGEHVLPAQSPLADDQLRALAFVRGRAAALDLLATGIRGNDRASVERAVSELQRPSRAHEEGN
jgi:rhomboid protease GluP